MKGKWIYIDRIQAQNVVCACLCYFSLLLTQDTINADQIKIEPAKLK